MFTPGTIVTFGRPNGEQTLGRVQAHRGRTVTVQQLEARGTSRIRQPGAVWKVAEALCKLAPADVAAAAPALPAAPAPALPSVPGYDWRLVNFKCGDAVEFYAKGRTVSGIVVSVNAKTASVVEAGRGRWRVSPGLLRKVAA